MEINMEKWKEEIKKKLNYENQNNNNGDVVSEEKKKWGRPSIYKISSVIKNQNRNAYEPKIVSFGPYHHELKDHLKAMEEHKNRALLQFLRRCSNKSIDFVYEEVKKVSQELKNSYETLDRKWNDNEDYKFLKLMIVDGCFMLEILRASEKGDHDAPTTSDDDYAMNDPVFGNHGKKSVMPYIKRDMLLLENQLPMLVLQKLTEIQTGKPQDDDDNENLNNRILKFLSPLESREGKEESEKKEVKEKRLRKCLHALDLYRKSLLNSDEREPQNMNGGNNHQSDDNNNMINIYRAASLSATELHEFGIEFRKSNRSLDSVSFQKQYFTGALLSLPHMVVDDTTESMFLNFIAFERLHVGAGHQVTSYVYFMDTIIDDEKDVALLHRREILVKALGCHNDVAKLFNSLAKDITPEQLLPTTSDIVTQMKDHCQKSWRRWLVHLRHTHCRNPWAIASFFAAILLFHLAIIQTWYSVASYYDQHLTHK